MLTDATGPWKVVLSALFFPVFFQSNLLAFCWAVAEPAVWLMVLKRVFLLLPALGFIMACWITIVSLVTVLVRHERIEFVMDLFVTWWDLGRAIIAFWGGALKFIFALIAGILATVKVLVLGVWTLIHDVILVPFRVVRNVGSNVLAPGVPWIAVVMTVIWAILEACIFTYVMTPLIMDTLSNMTGSELSEAVVRIPLFVFLLIFVMGSYAVLASWAGAIKSKDWVAVVKNSIIEGVVMVVEVMFLYREFVESLTPWFASKGLDLGIVSTLFIAGMAWFGVRGISWFLFGSAGTPTLLAVIQGSGVKNSAAKDPETQTQIALSITQGFIDQIRKEMGDLNKKGDDVMSAFVIPPLQIVAACVNFATLLLSNQHLFELPFRNFEQVMSSKVVLHSVSRKKVLVAAGKESSK